jgi:hypothetical protein
MASTKLIICTPSGEKGSGSDKDIFSKCPRMYGLTIGFGTGCGCSDVLRDFHHDTKPVGKTPLLRGVCLEQCCQGSPEALLQELATMAVKRKRPRSISLGGIALIQQAIFGRTGGGGASSFIRPSPQSTDRSAFNARQQAVFVSYLDAAGTILRKDVIVLQCAFLDEPLLIVSEKEEDKNQLCRDKYEDEGAQQQQASYLSLSSPFGTAFVSDLQQSQFLLAQFHENIRRIENRLASKRCGYSWSDIRQVVKEIHASVGKTNPGDIDSLLGLTDLIIVLLESCESNDDLQPGLRIARKKLFWDASGTFPSRMRLTVAGYLITILFFKMCSYVMIMFLSIIINNITVCCHHRHNHLLSKSLIGTRRSYPLLETWPASPLAVAPYQIHMYCLVPWIQRRRWRLRL